MCVFLWGGGGGVGVPVKFQGEYQGGVQVEFQVKFQGGLQGEGEGEGVAWCGCELVSEVMHLWHYGVQFDVTTYLLTYFLIL